MEQSPNPPFVSRILAKKSMSKEERAQARIDFQRDVNEFVKVRQGYQPLPHGLRPVKADGLNKNRSGVGGIACPHSMDERISIRTGTVLPTTS